MITPLRMPSFLPHDLCHGWSSSRWLPTHLLGKTLLVFALLHSTFQGQILHVTPGISRLPTFAFQSPIMKRAYYKVTAPFLLGPGFCLCPPKSVSQPCVSSSGSVVQLLESSSKRAYAIPSSAAPRAPAPSGIYC